MCGHLPTPLVGGQTSRVYSAPLVWVRRGSLVSPLQPLYDGPYAVLCRGPPLLHHQSRVVGQGGCRQPPQCLHSRGRHDWQPASPRQTAGFTPRRSCRNQAGLVFRPADFFTFTSGAATRWSRNRFPTWRGGFCMPRDRRGLHRCHRRGTRPVNGHRHGG